jgi:hypothetical protein
VEQSDCCDHLFGADCIKQWLEDNSAWMEDDDGTLMSWVPRCPHCRMTLSKRDIAELEGKDR